MKRGKSDADGDKNEMMEKRENGCWEKESDDQKSY